MESLLDKDKILQQIKLGKDIKVDYLKQKIYISLQSKIPFILIVPSEVKEGQTILLETNNKETSNNDKLFEQAAGNAIELNNYLNKNVPILVPILPGTSQPYYQQLAVECFENGERPDLDIIECIDSAKEFVKKEYNVDLNDKIFLNGYSTTGIFAQRFASIHPNLIDTACIGGASGSIPIPNSDLDYPLGTRNYEELFGQPFDEKSYKEILFDYYVGELEPLTMSLRNGVERPMHDMSYLERSVPTKQGEEYRKIYGEDMFERADRIVKLLKQSGYNITYDILPNIAHNEVEAIDIMSHYPAIVGAQGILSCNDKIISESYSKMGQRQHEYSKTKIGLQQANISTSFDRDMQKIAEVNTSKNVMDVVREIKDNDKEIKNPQQEQDDARYKR